MAQRGGEDVCSDDCEITRMFWNMSRPLFEACRAILRRARYEEEGALKGGEGGRERRGWAQHIAILGARPEGVYALKEERTGIIEDHIQVREHEVEVEVERVDRTQLPEESCASSSSAFTRRTWTASCSCSRQQKEGGWQHRAMQTRAERRGALRARLSLRLFLYNVQVHCDIHIAVICTHMIPQI